MTISEIRINSTGILNIHNCTFSTVNDANLSYSMYTIVSDAGSLIITESNIEYSMIWLVGGQASISDTSINGQSIVNYGIFSEDTILNLSNVSISGYSLGLRSIGTVPFQEQVTFFNCSSFIPIPVSLISNLILFLPILSISMVIFPFFVNFAALLSILKRICLSLV